MGDDSDIPNRQRQRTDLDEVKKALDEGAKMEDLWEKYFKTTSLEKKGSSAKLAAKTFVFTSNKHPDDWYPKVKDTSALKRRIQEFGTIEYLGENFAAPVEQGYISEEL